MASMPPLHLVSAAADKCAVPHLLSSLERHVRPARRRLQFEDMQNFDVHLIEAIQDDEKTNVWYTVS